jgi:hypothetical protein
VHVPKRGAGRAPSAREAAGRFQARRTVPGKTRRVADVPPVTMVIAAEEAEAEAGARAEVASAALDGMARTGDGIGRMLQTRRQLAVPPDDEVLHGTVIPPSRPLAERAPAAPMLAGPGSGRPLRVESLRRQRTGPEYRDYLVPPDGLRCQLCVMTDTRDRSGRWAQAAVRAEAADGWQAVLCRAHGRVVEREARRRGAGISVHELPAHRGGNGQVVKTVPVACVWCRRCGAEGHPGQPGVCPCGQPEWSGRNGSRARVPASAVRQPNAVIAVSRSYGTPRG